MTIVKLYSCLTSWWWLSFTPQERTRRWETWILGTTFTPARLIRNQLSDFHPRLKVAERMLLEQQITASNFFYSFFCVCQTAAQTLWFVRSSQNCFWNYTCANHTLRWNVHYMFLCHNQLSLSTHWLTCIVLSVKVKKKSVLKADYIPKCQSLYFPPWSSHMRTPHNGGTIWWHTWDYTHRVDIKSA